MGTVRKSKLKAVKRVLVANRGEISCRIQRTCHRLGIETIAVGSTIDQDLMHMHMADEAIVLGAPEARDSYLNKDSILRAALQHGADAIHPGYGFLSENPEFAEEVREAGLIFIGPSPEAIRAMGSKVQAKAIAQSVGVPVIPGYDGEGNLTEGAQKLGFPLLIKAVHGGGGKGMRCVRGAAEFEEALAACQREAGASFGNDHVMLEKYLERPRHVEVQVLGDSYGHVIALSDRDCSLQRRHQKVIEEAPAPNISPQLRKKLQEAALSIAKSVAYEGLGTVEFLLTNTDEFYFLEMNTRLQVEHPITEMILGLDLVEWQLRVAAQEHLTLEQEDLRPKGHAVEARLYAEDPAHHFLPSIGTITQFDYPNEEHFRVDTGVRCGDRITIYYDPMIAKVIAWAENRRDAFQALSDALSRINVQGIKTNLNYLQNLLIHPDVLKSSPDIDFIDRYQQSTLDVVLSPWTQEDGWRLNVPALQTCQLKQVASTDQEGPKHQGPVHLRAPMPGRVVSVMVGLNESVEAGQPLVILEAMKMEHTIRAPHRGIVDYLPFSMGDFCEEGIELIRLR